MAGTGGSSGERNAWEAASFVFPIVTVGLSLASAIMTVASTQCVYRDDGSPAGSVSYGDYSSFKYSAVADLVSAVLQGVAIWLEVVGKEKWANVVALIDKLVLALTSTSAPLLLAVDSITSCGPPRRRTGQQRSRSLCTQAMRLCHQLQLASLVSLSAVGSAAGGQIIRSVARDGGGGAEQEQLNGKMRYGNPKQKPKGKEEEAEEGEGEGNQEGRSQPEEEDEGQCGTPLAPPPWCRCPREATIPCCCACES